MFSRRRNKGVSRVGLATWATATLVLACEAGTEPDSPIAADSAAPTGGTGQSPGTTEASPTSAGPEQPTSAGMGPNPTGTGTGTGTGQTTDPLPTDSGAETTSGCPGASESPGFTELWCDDFSTFDLTRWATATHSFDENQAQFSPANVIVADGALTLSITAGDGAVKPYLAGEARTVDSYLYGRFETRARFAGGAGLVSSLFTFYDAPDFAENWNEIDVEFLGRYADRIQFNTIVVTNGRQTDEEVTPLSFDPTSDFHVYGVEWVPDQVRFFVDGQLVHVAETYAPDLIRPSKLMMNLWPADVPDWAGPLDPSAIPAEADYDWVRISTYDG